MATRYIVFKPTEIASYESANGRCKQSQYYIRFDGDFSGTRRVVSSITMSSEDLSAYLNTDINPSTPYVPQYPGSPATKKYVDDNIPTKVSDLTNDSDFQTATQVNQAISAAVSSAYKYKGSVANQAALPASGNTTGDVWNTEDTGMNYAWTGSAWDALGTIVDLSGKQDKLIAGNNIQIASDGKTISATDTKYTAGNGINIDSNNEISANTTVLATKTDLNSKQDTISDLATIRSGAGLGATAVQPGDNISDLNNDSGFITNSYHDSTKQDTLVSGTNIKTVNNQSLLGSGNISINGILSGAIIPPASATYTGKIWFDTMNNKFWGCDGTEWKEITPVLSVNGGTGSITVNDVKVSTTTPSSPTEGMIWYDTTNDVLNVYDGTQWNTIDTNTTYTAGDNIQISSSNVISATDTKYNAGTGISIGNVTKNGRQGPSPDGFHVPSTTEWQGLKTIMDGLSLTTGDGWRINLHMPFAGYRKRSDASLNNQDSKGHYWSSSPTSPSSDAARGMYLISSSASATYNDNRTNGFSVRCFKDSYVTPDSSWTVVQGTLGNAGIFWNQSEGLISITNGTTGYTMMDKNLGATTVYNDGDILSQANMGNMYQWGNNYGFQSTGTIVNTSSTQVDASSYGPTNPYSSDTFIIGNYDWSSVQNDDLWGDTTGIITQENVISNTGVLSVNGQTGNVTIEEGKEYNAGTGIGIGTEHSDMQGPAPDGFHVPTYKEWASLCGILTTTFSLASTDATMKTYLKMPCAGWRGFSDSDIGSQGSNGWYWSSTGVNNNSARSLIFGSNYIMAGNISYYAYGHPVRCFKDSPIIPDSSWTTLYDGSSVSTNAGIFYNSTLGLISVSGDGTTWYTIQDKNLGATTVYNDGDTLSEANCGKYYQWGNNYGFPFSGSVTTSSTKVDASNYGPGNYYSSSTFITTSSPYGNWSSTYNYNLWGGVSQGVWVGGDGNTIVNTGVLSVNGQAGKITIQEGIEYNAGEGIEIKNGPDYSAMQGPAPSGYHIPRRNEWVALCEILTTIFGLTSNNTTMEVYLKLPLAGGRNLSSADVVSQGSSGFYWSSTGYDTNSAYRLLFNSSSIDPQNILYRAWGFSVRCFSDSSVVPTSSWTTLYDGSSIASGAGIFWSSTDGLISVSGDGQTWYTIMDKNLGATTVYNSGDTLSESNCGKYYQWGNNYGFPRTGSVTTSAIKVSASNYGPGNYYNSSTFITASALPYTWDTSNNGNLRGGETGVVNFDNVITNTGVFSVNGQTGDVTIEEGITKIFTLSSLSDLTNAQAAYDWYLNGGNPIIKNSQPWTGSSIPGFWNLNYVGSTAMHFSAITCNGVSTNFNYAYWADLSFTLSNGTVTAITKKSNEVRTSSSVPTIDNKNIITLVV